MTTETLETPVFDIAKEKNTLDELNNALSNYNEGLKVAASEMNMPEIIRLSNLISETQKAVEKQAKKISRSTGEEVATKKSTVSAQFKVLVAEFFRRDDVQAALNELRSVNSSLKGLNIDFKTGNATEPGMINLIGGYRVTSPDKVGNIKRPRAAWYNESFGTNEDGTPKTYTSGEMVKMFGNVSDTDYSNMSTNNRKKILDELIVKLGLKNLTPSS